MRLVLLETHLQRFIRSAALATNKKLLHGPGRLGSEISNTRHRFWEIFLKWAIFDDNARGLLNVKIIISERKEF